MIRVVLDTNIIVSALLQFLGPSARILTLALNDSIRLCVSACPDPTMTFLRQTDSFAIRWHNLTSTLITGLMK